jgi:hypothetical protein
VGRRVTLAGAAQSSAEPGGSRRHVAVALAPLSCLTCPPQAPTARARAGWVDHRCLGDGDPGRIGAAGIPALRWTDAAATVAARP